MWLCTLLVLIRDLLVFYVFQDLVLPVIGILKHDWRTAVKEK